MSCSVAGSFIELLRTIDKQASSLEAAATNPSEAELRAAAKIAADALRQLHANELKHLSAAVKTASAPESPRLKHLSAAVKTASAPVETGGVLKSENREALQMGGGLKIEDSEADKTKNVFGTVMPPSPSRGRTSIPVASPSQGPTPTSARTGFKSSLAASPRVSASPPLPVAAASPRRHSSIVAERQEKLFSSLGFQSARQNSLDESSMVNTSVVSASGLPSGGSRRSLAELLKEDESKLNQGVLELRTA
jgi:hypothetical protein